jgi:hypothetical protein
MELNHRIHTMEATKNCVISFQLNVTGNGDELKYNKKNIEIQLFLKTPIFTSYKNSP